MLASSQQNADTTQATHNTWLIFIGLSEEIYFMDANHCPNNTGSDLSLAANMQNTDKHSGAIFRTLFLK